ncbi:MAG: hypothetical protein ACR2NZ_00950 [Rubripirellula sp.]
MAHRIQGATECRGEVRFLRTQSLQKTGEPVMEETKESDQITQGQALHQLDA